MIFVVIRRFFCLVVMACCGCALGVPPPSPPPPADERWPFAGFHSERYGDPRWWLCLPGRGDVCGGDLDATDVKADRSTSVVHPERRPGADLVDCFYVYPTVDLRLVAASHTDFSDLEAIRATTLAQAARFASVCNLYVPLYRQTTIGAYLLGPDARRPYREVAFSDVQDAFLYYMGRYNRGHKIVLLGHSQGSEMVVALLQTFFDLDPVARAQLLLAMPVGWSLEVDAGKTTGGTFVSLPVCSRKGETGCVVGYRSYDAEEPANAGPNMPSAGHESVCVNPAELAHGTEWFAGASLPTKSASADWVRSYGEVKTPFVTMGDFLAGRCLAGRSGFRYLGVFPTPRAGDRRRSPMDLSNGWLHGAMGFHILDMQFTQGDLIDLVAERAASLR